MRNKGPAFRGGSEGWLENMGAGGGEESSGEKEDRRGREKGRVGEEEGDGSGCPTVGRRAGNNADGITRVVGRGVEGGGGGSCVSGSTRAEGQEENRGKLIDRAYTGN